MSLTPQGERAVFFEQESKSLQKVDLVERTCQFVKTRDEIETGPRDKQMLRNYAGKIGANVAIAIETRAEQHFPGMQSGSKSTVKFFACPDATVAELKK
ncbi:MAG: hypothetical protein ACRD00_05745 [Thermoanaerobaculia bacterium]